MALSIRHSLPIVTLLLGIGGCNLNPTGGVAVVDLDRIANATGRDQAISGQVQSFAAEQEARLKQLQSELQQQVSSASERADADGISQKRRSLDKKVVEARNRLTRELNRARQSTQQLQQQLAREFATEIQPVARREAEARGLTVVLVKQPGLLFVAPEIDITDAVIDQIQTSSK